MAQNDNRPSRLIHGFHAVIAKLRHNPAAVQEIYLEQGRQDGRAKDLLRHGGWNGEGRGQGVVELKWEGV